MMEGCSPTSRSGQRAQRAAEAGVTIISDIDRKPFAPSVEFKLSAVESLSASKEGGWRMRFREEPVTPVYRHWMCEQVGCNGELLSTGEGITRLSTRWKHRCGKCGHEDWADATYPRVAYLPIDAIGPDDSYT
jgi:hypothetical protein